MKFSESESVATWVGLNSNLVQLWTMFVVGNFAACAFAISDPSLGVAEKIAMTIGFWLFALGNLVLIIQKLRILQKLKSYIQASSETEFVLDIAKLTHPKWYSIIFHVTIDLCVTAIIWRSVFAEI